MSTSRITATARCASRLASLPHDRTRQDRAPLTRSAAVCDVRCCCCRWCPVPAFGCIGHSKSAHHQVYIFPDGQRFDPSSSSSRTGRHSLALRHYRGRELSGPYGANCAQYYSDAPNDSGWEEEFHDNACFLQSAQLPLLVSGCDTRQLAGIAPTTYNNTVSQP